MAGDMTTSELGVTERWLSDHAQLVSLCGVLSTPAMLETHTGGRASRDAGDAPDELAIVDLITLLFTLPPTLWSSEDEQPIDRTFAFVVSPKNARTMAKSILRFTAQHADEDPT